MIKHKLQLFAEDSAATNQSTEQTGSEAEQTTEHKTKSEAKYTDEDVDRILQEKFAKWQEKQDKKISEAEKLAKMDAQQKSEYEKEQLKKELKALKDKETIAEMSKQARKMLSESNISISDDLLSMFVSVDADKTKKAVEDFKAMFSEAVKSAVTEILKGKAPQTGTTTNTLTKDEIMAVADRKERQRLIKENMTLF